MPNYERTGTVPVSGCRSPPAPVRQERTKPAEAVDEGSRDTPFHSGFRLRVTVDLIADRATMERTWESGLLRKPRWRR